MTQDVKYAGIRIRLNTAQARLGVVGGLIDGLAADAIEGIPVPIWQAPAEPDNLVTRVPPGNALPRGSSLADASQTGSSAEEPESPTGPAPKPLFPPANAATKGRRPKYKLTDLPLGLWDPICFDEMTPEIIAARAAWGFPFKPDLHQKLEEYQQRSRPAEPVGPGSPDSAHSGHSDQTEPTAASALRLTPTPNSQLPTPSSSPPPSEDCSPCNHNSSDADPATAQPIVTTHASATACDQRLTSSGDNLDTANPLARPLLTPGTQAEVVEVRLSPDQPPAAIVPPPAGVPLRHHARIEPPELRS